MTPDLDQTHLDALGLSPDRVFVAHPNLTLSDGTPFRPRAAILRSGKPEVVICAMANADLEQGLTRDIMAARQVPSASHVLHLRPRAGSALVGSREGKSFRYRFATDALTCGDMWLPCAALCALCDLPHAPGWSDTPLSGHDLPQFDDLDSFLAWWDLYPGKQRFDLHNGQVRQVPRGQATLLRDLMAALRNRLPHPYVALQGCLLQVDTRTAICPDIAIGPKPSGDSPFVAASVAVLLKSDGTSDANLSARQNTLLRSRTQVIVLKDPTSKASHDKAIQTAVDQVLSAL